MQSAPEPLPPSMSPPTTLPGTTTMPAESVASSRKAYPLRASAYFIEIYFMSASVLLVDGMSATVVLLLASTVTGTLHILDQTLTTPAGVASSVVCEIALETTHSSAIGKFVLGLCVAHVDGSVLFLDSLLASGLARERRAHSERLHLAAAIDRWRPSEEL